jgi:hypothetical protein
MRFLFESVADFYFNIKLEIIVMSTSEILRDDSL